MGYYYCFMHKRGVELALNSLVIAILVVLVLISLVIFFIFGFENVSNKIKSISQKSTGGMDRTLAIQLCNQYCDFAKGLDKEQRRGSSYCNVKFDIDDDGDGLVDLENAWCDETYVRNLGVRCLANGGNTICIYKQMNEYISQNLGGP